MGNTWSIRPYQKGDEQGIVELFEEVFDKPMGITESLKHWRWEFEQNPVGDKYIHLAVDDGDIVGQYAVIPMRMLVMGQESIGSLSLDTMVHPDYQGQGMFVELANSLYSRLSDSGISITYGFPNKNSMHGIFQRLDWKEICEMPILIRPVDFDRSLEKLWGPGVKSKIGSFLGKKYYDIKHKPAKLPEDLRVEKVEKFNGVDDLWRTVTNGVKIGAVRDQKYFDWRFVDKPEFDYQIYLLRKGDSSLGYLVTGTMDYWDMKVIFILDLLTEGSEYAKYLISERIKMAEDEAVICGLGPVFGPYKDLGFVSLSKEEFPQEIYFGARRNTGSIPFEVFSDKNKWMLSWADTDVV